MGWSFGKILILTFEDDEEHIINRIISCVSEDIEVLKHKQYAFDITFLSAKIRIKKVLGQPS